eukprot:gene14562-12372_t
MPVDPIANFGDRAERITAEASEPSPAESRRLLSENTDLQKWNESISNTKYGKLVSETHPRIGHYCLVTWEGEDCTARVVAEHLARVQHIPGTTKQPAKPSSERDCWDVDFEDDVGTVGSWLTREEHGLINIGYNFEIKADTLELDDGITRNAREYRAFIKDECMKRLNSTIASDLLGLAGLPGVVGDYGEGALQPEEDKRPPSMEGMEDQSAAGGALQVALAAGGHGRGMAVDAVLSAVGARDKQKETRDSEPKTDAAIMRKIQKVFKFADLPKDAMEEAIRGASCYAEAQAKVFTVMDPQGILEGIGKKLAGLDIGGTITTNIAKRQYVAAEQPACDAAFVRFGAVKQAASSIPFTEPNPNVDAEGVPTVTSNLLQNNIITQHTLDFEFPDPVGDYNIPDCDGRTLLGELCAVPKKDLDPCVAVQIVLDAGGKAQFPCSVTLFVGAAIMSVYRNTGELSNGTIIPARSVGETDDRSWMLALVEAGAKVDAQNAAGQTALMLAASVGRTAMCKFLLGKHTNLTRGLAKNCKGLVNVAWYAQVSKHQPTIVLIGDALRDAVFPAKKKA